MKYFKYFFFLPASLALLVASCSKSSNSNSAETSGDWIKCAEAGFAARSEAVSFVIGNKVYIGTGFDNYSNQYPGNNTTLYNNGKYNDLWVFDPTANGNLGAYSGLGTFSQPSYMVSGTDTASVRSGAVAFVCNGKGYVATGNDGKYNLIDNWEYTPGTNTWARKASLPQDPNFPGINARRDAVAFAIRDTGYIAGGLGNRALNDLLVYDPINDKWTSKTSMPQSRYAACSFVYNNKAYVVTGTGSSGNMVKEMLCYNPGTSQWTSLGDIINTANLTKDDDYTDIARSNAVLFVLGDYAYLTTGTINGSYTAKTWMYEIATDTWTRKTPYQRALREGAIGFTVNGRCFVALGSGGGAYFNNTSEFRPDLTYDASHDSN